MNRPVVTAALWCLTVAPSVFGTTLPNMPDPVPQRVAAADVVVVGKVTGFTDKAVSLPRSPGDKEKADHQIAIIKVTEAIFGASEAKEIRVAFVPPPPANPRPGVLVLPDPTQVQLTRDQEACFFLTRIPDTDLYSASMLGAVLDKGNMLEYKGALTEARRIAKLLAEPKMGLASKNAEDRFATAILLVQRYRTPRGRQKTEPIDAEESKLILKVLSEADWTLPRPFSGLPLIQAANPHLVIGTLGATEKDGWKQPANFRAIAPAARKWYKDNAEKFVIQKYVAGEEKK
jgi:hypothetical protein